jgi:hypothetical protein
MALIAEELVQEWLNREGFFTIRGIKIGRDEIDLLAVRPNYKGTLECRHVEVQVSVGPIGYIANAKIKSARKRTKGEIKSEARAWVGKKFKAAAKQGLRSSLCKARANWSFHLVHGNVKDEAELGVIKSLNIQLHDVRDILKKMAAPHKRDYSGATGKDLVDLVTTFGSKAPSKISRKKKR